MAKKVYKDEEVSFTITDFDNPNFIHCGNRNCQNMDCTRNYAHIRKNYYTMYMIDFFLEPNKKGICEYKITK